MPEKCGSEELNYDRVSVKRKPEWLKCDLKGGAEFHAVEKIVDENALHTICSSGKCPNKTECWSRRTATFMVLGEVCTRSCRFCATHSGKPLPVDVGEPLRVARSVVLMGLRHVVLTSVTRDDLPDGGAAHWAAVIEAVREATRPRLFGSARGLGFARLREVSGLLSECRPSRSTLLHTPALEFSGEGCVAYSRRSSLLSGTPARPKNLSPHGIELCKTLASDERMADAFCEVRWRAAPSAQAKRRASNLPELTSAKNSPSPTIEVLIPDFDGREELLDIIVAARPDIIGHNLETVRRLTPTVRSKARYETSLKVLRHIAARGAVAKSGLMLGLGETREEVLEAMDDLRDAGVEILTLGQYLQPSREHLSVVEYITPEMFDEYRAEALARGFSYVASGPLVRSSYRAEEAV